MNQHTSIEAGGTQRAVVLFCHRDPFVVANRLRLLAATESEPLAVLFGGRDALQFTFTRAVRLLLSGTGIQSHFFAIRNRSALWKWANTDLALREWFLVEGRQFDFRSVVLLQWDMIVAEGVDVAYGHIPQDAAAFAGLTRLATVGHTWPWLEHAVYRDELRQLTHHVRRRYGYDGEAQVCLRPGYVLPRAFLERYADDEIPDLCHYEVRLPVFAKAYGFEVRNTGFVESVLDAREEDVFNTDERLVPVDRVKSRATT